MSSNFMFYSLIFKLWSVALLLTSSFSLFEISFAEDHYYDNKINNNNNESINNKLHHFDLNFRPVVCILSIPSLSQPTRSYIAASYVKIVEMGGGRVMPIIYDENSSTIYNKLNLCDGVIFTGGTVAKNSSYRTTLRNIFERVIEKNDNGEYYPCFAICLGFQLVSKIISQNELLLSRIEALNRPSTLDFQHDTTMFPEDFQDKLETDNIAMFNHHYAIRKQKFERNARLSNFFRIVTTSKNANNEEYVSTAEGRRYPFTGFQWHPEKNAFEGGLSKIPHTADAVLATQYVANHMIRQAKIRGVYNNPDEQIVRDNLIWKYRPYYSGRNGVAGKFDQVYMFPQSVSTDLFDEDM